MSGTTTNIVDALIKEFDATYTHDKYDLISDCEDKKEMLYSLKQRYTIRG